MSLEDELSHLEDEAQQKLHLVHVDDHDHRGPAPVPAPPLTSESSPASTPVSAPEEQPDDVSSSLLPAADSGRSGIRTRPDLIRLESGGMPSGVHLACSVLELTGCSETNIQPSSNNDQLALALSPDIHTPQPPDSLQDIGGGASWPAFPSRETAFHLIDIFLTQHEVQYPIFVSDELSLIVLDYYASKKKRHNRTESSTSTNTNTNTNTNIDAGRDEDAWNRFILNMVFAISHVVLSHENAESLVLAKSFNAAAVADFNSVMQPRKGVRTVQCLLLVLLWSTLGFSSTSSTPIWYTSGLCMRMCVDLGFHSEATIKVSGLHRSATENEIDIKRRLFWVAHTFDRTVSILLGRPFLFSDIRVDVQLPLGSLPKQKQTRDAIPHWFKLQQLQSQIACQIYDIYGDDKTASLNSNSNSNNNDDGGGDNTKIVMTQWERISRARDMLMRFVDTSISIIENDLYTKLPASDKHVLHQAHVSPISRNKTILRQLGYPLHTSTRGDMHSYWSAHHDYRSSYGTPTNYTAVNTPRLVRSNSFQSQADNSNTSNKSSKGSNSSNNDVYAMHVLPCHHGQTISPQWVTTTDSEQTFSSHGILQQEQRRQKRQKRQHQQQQHPSPLAPFHVSDMNCTPLQQEPTGQLLDQQARWRHFGIRPENITMLDHVSASVVAVAVAVDERGAPHYDNSVDRSDSTANNVSSFQADFSDLVDFSR